MFTKRKQISFDMTMAIQSIWGMKGLDNSPISILVTFYCQQVFITLQKMQESSILSWMVAMGLATS
jgi:hypothetical protein